jgi:hypothetical protein
MDVDDHCRGGRAASAVARFLREPGRGEGEVRRDVARVVGAESGVQRPHLNGACLFNA